MGNNLMASMWMLSKTAMKGMNIVSTISDFIEAVKQGTHTSDDSRERVLHLLHKIAQGAMSFRKENIAVDSFYQIIAEKLAEDRSCTPSELESTIKRCADAIREGLASPDCLDFLRSVAQQAMQVTSRSVYGRFLVLK